MSTEKCDPDCGCPLIVDRQTGEPIRRACLADTQEFEAVTDDDDA